MLFPKQKPACPNTRWCPPTKQLLQLHYRKYQTRVESLSEIIDKLGRNRLVPRDKELKIMRLLCDTGVPKLMPRRVVACDADGGMWCRGWHVMPMVACDAEGGLWCMFLEVNEVLPVLARIKLTSVCVSVDRSGIMRSSVWSLQTLKRGAQICLQYYYLLYSFGLGTKQVMSVASEAYRSVPFWIYLNNNWNL